ncbi:MAG: MazG family protein [Candidatus Gracilibacteria bacterium]|nr:MazG family protein [Candidatus Gracilibacteria bacterium]
MSEYSFQKLVDLVAELRSEHGCPWDREQTFKSLIPSITEEVEEVVHAIEADDMENLKEELGDVLLNVLLQAQIAKEAGLFEIKDVLAVVSEKIVRRHPHVFGDKKFETSAQVLEEWAKIKKSEKGGVLRIQY